MVSTGFSMTPAEFRALHQLLKLEDMVILSAPTAMNFAQRVCEKFRERLDDIFLNSSGENEDYSESIKNIWRDIASRRFNFCYEKNGEYISNKEFLKSYQFVKMHNNREYFAQINHSIRNKDVHVFQQFSEPVYDMEALKTLIDAAVRGGAQSITVYVPFGKDLRQDKKDDGRVPILAKQFFNDLESVCRGKLKRIVTIDLHAKQEQGFFDGPVDEISALPSFALYFKTLFRRIKLRKYLKSIGYSMDVIKQAITEYKKETPDSDMTSLFEYFEKNLETAVFDYMKEMRFLKKSILKTESCLFEIFEKEIGNYLENLIVVAPDPGAVKRAEGLANMMRVGYSRASGNGNGMKSGAVPVGFVYKTRTGHGQSEARAMSGNVEGKEVIFIDDIIDTGGSILNACKLAKELGANNIYIAATHGVFSPKLQSVVADLPDTTKEYYSNLCETDKAEFLWSYYINLPSSQKAKYQAEFHLDRSRLEGIVDRVVITDTVPPKHNRYYESCSDWLDVFSMTPILATILYCSQIGSSVSEVMDQYSKYIMQEDARLKFIELEFALKL